MPAAMILGAGRQADRQPPGGDVIDGAPPGVGGGDAVADQPLVQRQIWELGLVGLRIGCLSAGAPGRGLGIEPLARSGRTAGARAVAAGRVPAVVPGGL
jgi:hypothetical protein